ncbi:MAG: 2-dehydropantoate 2-reductase [Gammaproteobacteria bacterium]|nr:2-dehydropantoate 2-reductase [Gammaproteobacteria bacterium]NDE55957.1 2-dehydropantoate 2-reductase [Gammaproteobacteria bacterium]NDG87185.1 2-dehydropantoate 2-reductase [Gammaproteobacteria bacterium]
MNILIIGTGAIGSFYGSLLAKAGHRVSVLARSDFEIIKDRGIRLTSDTPLGQWHFMPAEVIRDQGTLTVEPDIILLCTKVLESLDRVALVRPYVGPSTAIGLLSNGVEIEAPIQVAFKDHEIISGLAFICVTRTHPGTIWHQSYGHVTLGNYPCGISEKTRLLAESFELSGIKALATENIVTARWQKCVWNAAFNPLSVISGGLNTQEMLAFLNPLIRSIMDEVMKIAAAAGHPLEHGVPDQQIEGTLNMPAYRTSMLNDYESFREMEIEAILGNTVRAAERVGVAHPHLATLYQLMTCKAQRESRKPRITPAPKEALENASH